MNCGLAKEDSSNIRKKMRITGRVACRMPRDHSNAARFESGSRLFKGSLCYHRRLEEAFSRAHVTGRMLAGNKENASRKLRERVASSLSVHSPSAWISERRKRRERERESLGKKFLASPREVCRDAASRRLIESKDQRFKGSRLSVE